MLIAFDEITALTPEAREKRRQPRGAVARFLTGWYWRSSPMASIVLRVNGQDRPLPESSTATLQFALRDDLGLTGTKFGCGVGQCGCCTGLIDGQPARSCRTQVTDVIGKEITTIEGLAPPGGLHPLQQAWIDA